MKTNHYRLESCNSIAVIGGTFDPIHNGHLAAAEAVAEAFKPQKVMFIPSGLPPHKIGKPVTPAEHRYQMTLLATADNPAFDVSRMELEREGPSFTVDTLRELKAECRADAEIFFITGADAMKEILTWHNAPELLKSCRFIAVTRPGSLSDELREHIEILRRDYSARIDMLDVPGMEISGSDLRGRLAAGRPVRYMLPRVVEDYIRRNNLYGTSPPDFDKCKEIISKRLSQKRFAHTMGVVASAEELAARYGGDIAKARLAALLHDCAKEYSNDKKRTLCELWGIPLDDVLDKQISITHSLLGAESARRDFGVTDGEILRAIRLHTTGGRGMSLLDKIIMLADFIEPTREPYYGLEEVRALAYTDMNGAIRRGIEATIKYNEDMARPIHPWGLEALEEL